MTDDANRTMRERLAPLVLIGWTVAAIRLVLEFAAPEESMFFGVYYAMPVALLWAGMTGRFRGVRVPHYLLGIFVVALLVWTVPNAITYTLGQFLGWEHGRFQPAVQSAPIAESALAKLGTGVMVAALTTVAGTLWMLVWSLPLGWLPTWLRGPKPATRSAG